MSTTSSNSFISISHGVSLSLQSSSCNSSEGSMLCTSSAQRKYILSPLLVQKSELFVLLSATLAIGSGTNISLPVLPAQSVSFSKTFTRASEGSTLLQSSPGQLPLDSKRSSNSPTSTASDPCLFKQLCSGILCSLTFDWDSVIPSTIPICSSIWEHITLLITPTLQSSSRTSSV